jgi:hypothetical protein
VTLAQSLNLEIALEVFPEASLEIALFLSEIRDGCAMLFAFVVIRKRVPCSPLAAKKFLPLRANGIQTEAGGGRLE